MFDTLVKLLEKLVELTKYRREAEEKAFELLVTPIFESLRVVHKDYLKMFRACQRELVRDTDIHLIIERLTKDRLELEPLRRSITAYMSVYIGDEHLKKYRAFFVAVEAYIGEVKTFKRSNTRSGILLTGLEEFVRGVEQGVPDQWEREQIAESRRALVAESEAALDDVRGAWYDVSWTYAALNAKRAKP